MKGLRAYKQKCSLLGFKANKGLEGLGSMGSAETTLHGRFGGAASLVWVCELLDILSGANRQCDGLHSKLLQPEWEAPFGEVVLTVMLMPRAFNQQPKRPCEAQQEAASAGYAGQLHREWPSP